MRQGKKVVVEAPGKVNLYLNIVGTDQRQYHLLQTVMHSIDLQDKVTIEWKKSPQIRIALDDTWRHIPMDDSNIAYQSAMAFFKATGEPQRGMKIYLDKSIPDQAGLGGGSSDAAAVLVGLNHLYKTGLTTKELCEIGVTVGADVPFCIAGGCALAEGIGEKMTPKPALSDGYLVIVKPLTGVSTPEAFGLYDALPTRVPPQPLEQILMGLQAQDLAAVGKGMHNVFEQALHDLPIGQIKERLQVLGALGAALSGSGSAVVGLFAEQKKAHNAYRTLVKEYEQTYLARPLSYGARVIEG